MHAAETISKDVLFIHGGGDQGYEADQPLANSLRAHLGAAYNVRYPKMPNDVASPDFGWGEAIGHELAAISGEPFLVGHSLGASMLLKYLSEHDVSVRVRGLFLLATTFWSGDEPWQVGLKLDPNFADVLPRGLPIFLYHNEDDSEAEISDLDIYRAKLPQAHIHRGATGGHQFNDDLKLIARDIRALG